jgi:hypothetical protein
MLTHIELHRATRVLAGRDADLARVVRAHGPPPLWQRRPGFPTLVHIGRSRRRLFCSSTTGSCVRPVSAARRPATAATSRSRSATAVSSFAGLSRSMTTKFAGG